MLLPIRTEFDLPLFPPLGKDSIPVLAAIFGILYIKKTSINLLNRREDKTLWWLLIFLFISPIITSFTNSNSILNNTVYIEGMSLYDGVSILFNQSLLVIPFFIGRRFFRTYEQQLLFFKMLITAVLIYSVFMLIEVRISPQLHTWLYGYFPYEFNQQKRFGGFRPVVWMGHGLWVAFFTFIALSIAIILNKSKMRVSFLSPLHLVIYLFILLVLCKSMGSVVYGFLFLLALSVLSTKLQAKAALFLAIIAISYPFLTITEVFPHNQLVSLAESVNEERAGSLAYRFEQDAMTIERAKEKIFFGWGGWSRNLIFDPETGKQLSVLDGHWIKVFSKFGLFGFIAQFGIMFLCVYRSYQAYNFISSAQEKKIFVGHMLIIGFILIDQLVNRTLVPFIWLVIGVQFGRAEFILSQQKKVTRFNS
jgi:hypothetical protein